MVAPLDLLRVLWIDMGDLWSLVEILRSES